MKDKIIQAREKREREIKTYVLKYIRNLKNLPKLPKPDKYNRIGIAWLEVGDNVYLATKDKFHGIYGYGNDRDWWDGKMSWVFWYVVDEVDNLINRLKLYSKNKS